MRAKCSVSSDGSRTMHREVEREPGDVGERVGRVDRQRREDREDLLGEVGAEPLVLVGVELGPVRDPDALLGSAGATASVKHRAWRSISSPVRSLMLSSCSRTDRPSALRMPSRAAARRFRPATRTMKNSSRLPAKMARNLTRSSSGVVGSSASCSTRPLNSSQETSRLRKRPFGRSGSLGGAFGRSSGSSRADRGLRCTS